VCFFTTLELCSVLVYNKLRSCDSCALTVVSLHVIINAIVMGLNRNGRHTEIYVQQENSCTRIVPSTTSGSQFPLNAVICVRKFAEYMNIKSI
jgi:hypothetical protein